MPDISTTTEVMNNLVESEAKLGELNNRLVDIQDQYNNISANTDVFNFFNFSNVYFWVVLIGLILLAFGLLFLLIELSHPEARKPKDKYHVPAQKSYKKSPEAKPVSSVARRVKKSGKKSKTRPAPVRKTGKKPVKVKVIKVK
mgnify:CR=1 FL=1|jgi:hypothetical protein